MQLQQHTFSAGPQMYNNEYAVKQPTVYEQEVVPHTIENPTPLPPGVDVEACELFNSNDFYLLYKRRGKYFYVSIA